jgi:hypothetical protein
MPFSHQCNFCSIDFISSKREAKFCSLPCKGKYFAEALIVRNKARQKYADVPGLTRKQIAYRETDGADAKRDVEKRHTLLVNLGGKCVCCGYNKDLRGLVLDHINGDGYEDRKRIKGKIARYYINNPTEAKQNLQVLCATCNQIKSMENNEHNRSRRVIFNKAA